MSKHLIWPFLLMFSGGCGLTIGVEESREILSAEHDADGIDSFQALNVFVRDDVTLVGGANRVQAEVDTVRWSDESAGETGIAVVLSEFGRVLSYSLSGNDEFVTVRSASFEVSSGMSVVMSVEGSGVIARDLDGTLDIKSDGFSEFEECTGELRIDAPSVSVQSTQSVDVTATNTLNAGLSGGGSLIAREINLSMNEVSADYFVSTAGQEEGGRISAFVPREASFTLFIQAKQRGFVSLDDFAYESNEEVDAGEVPRIIRGIEVDIGGGGPRVELIAETAVFVYHQE